MPRSRACAVAVVALGLTLTACGGGSTSSTPSPHVQDEIVSPITSGRQDLSFYKGPVTIAGATQGGTVTVLTHDGLPDSLDPSGTSAREAVSLLSGLVTRSLTQYGYDRRTRRMVLRPDLATNLGVHNDNYTKWQFTVRPGVHFQDGTRVTPFDVARGIRRCWLGQAFPTSPCHQAPIKSVTVRRRQDVLIRFNAPFPDMPYLAAMPAVGPIPKGTPSAPGAYSRHPEATGPYRVRKLRPGHRLVLVRNPEWVTRSDPVRTQYPDRYVFRSGLSDAAISRHLQTDHGRARTSLTYDAMRPQAFGSPDDQARLVLGATPCTTYLALDDRAITDPAVRRALIWAYPYLAVLRAEGLTPGATAIAASSLMPPGVARRTPYRTRGHSTFATRPRVAHRMLAQAHALGTPLRFAYSPGLRASVRAKDALVRSLRASGFDPEPQSSSGAVDLRTSTRCGAWPVGSQWLPSVYPSNRYVQRRARHIDTIPLEASGGAWNRLDHSVLRRWQPVVPLWYGGVAMAHGSRIQGMVDDTELGMPDWSRLWVGGAS